VTRRLTLAGLFGRVRVALTHADYGDRPTRRAAPPPAALPQPTLPARAPTFVQVEQAVWTEAREQIRQQLEARLEALAVGQAATVRPGCCGRRMHRHDRRRVGWLTCAGRVHVWVWRYRCPVCRSEQRPLLDVLQVEPGRLSGRLARLVALVGSVAPYTLAAELVRRLLGVELNAMTVWRAVQRVGEAATQPEAALSAYHAAHQTGPAEPGEAPPTVVVAVDGCALGMQVRPTRRHAPGPEAPPLPPVADGHFREVKTGVLLQPAERVETTPGRRSLVRRVLVTYLGEADILFDRVWAALCERGWLGAHTLVVVIGDGSEWIWRRAERFTRRCEILDFWHALEYAWAYARAQFGDGSRRAEPWVRRLARDLKAGEVEAVLARLHTLHPRSAESRTALDALVRYYTTHAARMQYDEYQRLGYGIGSGAVESAHKQVVHARLRQAGMRWSVGGASRLLALRLYLLNGEWGETERLRLAPIAA
jgi:hypothetical protein